LLGADVLNASENQILVAQGDGTLSVETQAQGPNPYNASESFTESDLSLDTTNLGNVNGSLTLTYFNDSKDTGVGNLGYYDVLATGDITGDGSDNIVIEKDYYLKYYDVVDDSVVEIGSNTAFDNRAVTVGDFTGDGTGDVAFSNTNRNLLYYDTESNTEVDTGETANKYVDAGDITGDGVDEIVFVEDSTDNLKYYNPDTDTTTDTGNQSRTCYVADVDDDDENEIVFYDKNSNVKYYKVSTDTTTDTQNQAYALEVGDVTGDGATDIVFEDTSGNIKYYDVINDTTTDTGVDGDLAEVGDITGSGKDDIVFKDSSDVVKFYDVSNNTTETVGVTVENSDRIKSAGIYQDDYDRMFYPDSDDNLVYFGFVAASSGTAILEWPNPSDIYEWDVVTFTRTLNNETVDVFVAYSSDDGSTWTRTNSGNPITRNYSLEADAKITADVDVRIEAELSRTDRSNNPTLDSAYRSWFV
jgi:hypothetical protein